ncbi:MAG: beta-lactamase family protein [Chitinophagales bacterium]|nr:beta-lactamase family protein [Chitinophagales bacterium]
MHPRTLVYSLIMLVTVSCQAQPTEQSYTPKNFRFKPIPDSTKQRITAAVQEEYQKTLGKVAFSGGIIIAKNGEILLEDYKGYYNQRTGELMDANTPIHLASVSKTFTAMAVLHLWEQGKFGLDDDVRTHFPSFPYEGMTIKMLLSHRSGMPNYLHFTNETKAVTTYRKGRKGRKIKVVKYVPVKDPFRPGLLTNQDILDFMAEKKPAIQSRPDTRFQYCNTNYVMLALLVEKITGQSFPQYMKDSVFTPLGMKNSFVFSKADTGRYIPSYMYNNRVYGLERLDCTYGDKNIYSTPREMLIWDKVLYDGSFVKNSTLSMAFEPLSNERKSQHNYGLGWRMIIHEDSSKIVYHNGWWHGNNTVFTRLIEDTATVIILGNKFNKMIYSLGRRFPLILTNDADSTDFEE